jgi:hypothetical protein
MDVIVTLSSFLTAFFSDEHELIHLRVFAPKKSPSDDPRFSAHKFVVTRHRLETDRKLQDQLIKFNKTRGVYFVVNAGGDSDDKINRFTAWFTEDDTRSIEQQHRMLDAAPLAPSARVETNKSVHAFWLIKGECSEQDWRNIQQRLITHFGGDEQIKNPSRLMRLPYFNHVRYDNESGGLQYKPVELVAFEPERRYTVAEMRSSFPPAHESLDSGPADNSIQKSSAEFATWDELHSATARQISQSEQARTNSKGWTHAPGLCHGSTEGTAIAVSPDGAYKCHKGCSAAQVRIAYGLPERPNTTEPERDTSSTRPNAGRITHFTLTPLRDLLSEPAEEVAYVWGKTLPRGGFSICAAKPKVGKSTFVRNLCKAVARGEEFFGRMTQKGLVIYLCLEEKRAEIAEHFRRMGMDDENIVIHTGRTPSDALAALEAAVEELSPVLVVIDPLVRFVGIRDFNDYGQVTRGLEPIIDLAREASCQPHIMAVHHNGKGERDGGDSLLGSTALFGTVDTLLTMRKRGTARTIESIQRYGENIAETVVNLEPHTGLTTPGGDLEALNLSERKGQVLESIGEESLPEGDIKERVGGHAGLTSKAIRALCGEGLLERTGAGKKNDPFLYKKRVEPTPEEPSLF